MSETATVVPGDRTIRYIPTAEPDQRREGTIDHDEHREKVWCGPDIQSVIDMMDEALGTIPDEQYHIVEMAWQPTTTT